MMNFVDDGNVLCSSTSDADDADDEDDAQVPPSKRWVEYCSCEGFSIQRIN